MSVCRRVSEIVIFGLYLRCCGLGPVQRTPAQIILLCECLAERLFSNCCNFNIFLIPKYKFALQNRSFHGQGVPEQTLWII